MLDAAGFAVGIRASAGPNTVGPDGFPVCPAFGLHDLTIDGLTIRNASFTGILFRGVDGFAIRNGAYSGNAAYAVFPICSRDGIIERNHVEGTTDGAIYVGNSWDVVVADNYASASTVGIEIENSIGITVRNNRATGNSAGIAVFSLPGLPIAQTSDIVITGNTTSGNNLPNPIPPGSDPIGSVPTGSGILSIATNERRHLGQPGQRQRLWRNRRDRLPVPVRRPAIRSVPGWKRGPRQYGQRQRCRTRHHSIAIPRCRPASRRHGLGKLLRRQSVQDVVSGRDRGALFL